jgi:hypothetical protein
LSKIHNLKSVIQGQDLDYLVDEEYLTIQIEDRKIKHLVSITHEEARDLLSCILRDLEKYKDSTGKQIHKIITIIGSTKFQKEIDAHVWELTKQGVIALVAPFQKEFKPEIEEYRETLEQIHFRKIDLADEVHVFIKDHHLGVHSTSELNYAQLKNKIIKFIEV